MNRCRKAIEMSIGTMLFDEVRFNDEDDSVSMRKTLMDS